MKRANVNLTLLVTHNRETAYHATAQRLKQIGGARVAHLVLAAVVIAVVHHRVSSSAATHAGRRRSMRR